MRIGLVLPRAAKVGRQLQYFLRFERGRNRSGVGL